MYSFDEIVKINRNYIKEIRNIYIEKMRNEFKKDGRYIINDKHNAVTIMFKYICRKNKISKEKSSDDMKIPKETYRRLSKNWYGHNKIINIYDALQVATFCTNYEEANIFMLLATPRWLFLCEGEYKKYQQLLRRLFDEESDPRERAKRLYNEILELSK